MCNTGGYNPDFDFRVFFNTKIEMPDTMYKEEKCKDCDSKLKCLTGSQWLCSKTDTSLYTYNIDHTKRFEVEKFSWKKLLKRWL